MVSWKHLLVGAACLQAPWLTHCTLDTETATDGVAQDAAVTDAAVDGTQPEQAQTELMAIVPVDGSVKDSSELPTVTEAMAEAAATVPDPVGEPDASVAEPAVVAGPDASDASIAEPASDSEPANPPAEPVDPETMEDASADAGTVAETEPEPAFHPDAAVLAALGKQVFFDNISQPATQSCASCHVPANGWTSGDSGINQSSVVVPGAAGTSGRRKPPTSAYAALSTMFSDAPPVIVAPAVGTEDETSAEADTDAEPAPAPPSCLSPDATATACIGGLFWDGRATGTLIGAEIFADDAELEAAYAMFLGPAADQALGPFGNPVEHNALADTDHELPGGGFVCQHVANAPYAGLYEQAFGEAPDCSWEGVDISFKRIALAIAAWEHSSEVNSFSSRRDLALAADDDDTPQAFPLANLSDQENLGHDLFYGLVSELNPEGKDARCSLCHNSEGAEVTGNEPAQLYTDGSFHHLGLPPNFDCSNNTPETPDYGLALHTNPTAASESLQAGAFRTPTLRNVAKRESAEFIKAYMHNGYFKNLEDVVHFYNTALLKLDPDACPPGTPAAEARSRDCWPAPEVESDFMASKFGILGDLGLTADEEAALVAFLETLSDTAVVLPPAPYEAEQ